MTRPSSVLFWSLMMIVASLALYSTSYRVHDLSKQLHGLNVAIDTEQRNLHVLKAEWVYLSNPTKIEQAAKKYLPLQQATLKQIAKLEDISELLPTRTEAMASMTVNNTPIASIRSSLPIPASTARTQQVASAEDHTHVNTRLVIKRSSGSTSGWSGKSQMILANIGARP